MAKKEVAFARSCRALGRVIRQRRRQISYTQTQLADRVKITQESISAIELGRGWGSMPTFILIAKALGLLLSELFVAAE